MSNEEIISSFLKTAYSDAQLAALLCHVQDGKFSYMSCCCFIGIATADHALRGKMGSVTASMMAHYEEACEIPNADKAETAFLEIGAADNPSLIIPFVLKEMERRERLKIPASVFGAFSTSGGSVFCAALKMNNLLPNGRRQNCKE